ncbi:MAG: AAA family ATPase [Pseudomonadota bacterium]
MFLRSMKLTNFLSFGPAAEPLELRPLNMLIGPNGSGKSNVIEALALLRSAPNEVSIPVQEGGGVHDWLWKGAHPPPTANLDFELDYPLGKMPLRYSVSFTERAQRFSLVDERIENAQPYPDHDKPYMYFGYVDGRPMLNVMGKPRQLKREDVHPEKSILAQRKDPDHYPEITWLGSRLAEIRTYRDWSFGRSTAPGLPHPADVANDDLQEDCRNLGLVLNRIRREPEAKREMLDALRLLYDGIEDFDVKIEGGTVQVFLQEAGMMIPATRLANGTLRYLCLLAILCHPEPPPLVCIEEPELGLYPDVATELAALLQRGAERMQLVVTTHADALVDALTATPEAVIVCEKREGSTTLKRLSSDELTTWLDRYTLGHLWRSGEIGANRW